ncbi:hypothetical protein [Clostridium sp.]|uniref:hypothetical protein n=1 Tax=Clostridium sp. TaxID=1506 RepID=UPI00290B18BA|nr:hypothetical protein [Clostridium sp.]MDU5107710.1 hypothetical protein [Clostridium sp.]
MSKSKIFYIVGLVILCFNFIGMFARIPILGEMISLLNIGFVVTFLSINFIWSLVRFQTQISKEKGKLLFTLPIKSHEFIIAKIIEFILIQGIIVFITMLMTLISGNSLRDLVNLSSIAVMYGTIIAYIIIISFMVIFLSYIKNTALYILAVVIGGSIIQGIVEGIIKTITNFLPYIYMKIGTFIEIDLVHSLLSLSWIIFIVYLAIYHLDKKLDII